MVLISLADGRRVEKSAMCRNIRPLFNFDQQATADEIREASLQYVRKISGFNKPSEANKPPFESAVNEVAAASTRLLSSLKARSPAKNRQEEAAKAKGRSSRRFRS